MKNLFNINFIWLGIIIFLLSVILFCSCQCGYYCFQFSQRTEGVLIGILSSAILLFLTEWVLFIRDKTCFGFLSGEYKRLSIYQINKNGKQWDINDPERPQSDEFIEYKQDSIYHRLKVYDKIMETHKIKLNYLHSGKYIGKADYNEGSVDITIALDTTNEMQGKGIYQYYSRKDGKLPDIGNYKIQVVYTKNHTLLYVYYKNTIPTGAAEGYQIWEKIK